LVGIPALHGIDTRQLTKKIRLHGSILGKIEFPGQPVPLEGSVRSI
jgi:carbamoyl-phosphate synthase (ammonia)